MASKTERTSLTPKLISLAVASCFATGAALANPTGPTVVNGQVTINQAGNLLSITNSPNAIINWNGFSISAGEITRFIQQNPSSAVLNRVVGGVPSDILGALQSRLLDGVTTGGRVFLINPSGIVFGPGSQIDVGGLVASTLALSNEDFLGGRLRFTAEPGAGSVINNGAINTATGGQVYLVGTSVTNNGVITNPKGEVILAAGNSVELVNPGTPNLRVEITAPDNEARNLGSIVAEAGRVGIYAGLIQHGGTIRADSAVATEDGRIVLRATKNTTIEAGSIISASGPSGGQVTIQSGDTTLVSGSVSATGSAGKGGTVQVLGNLVGLDDAASIDVSGAAGGGTALVGGDFQGKNPNVQNAFRTWFGPNAKINADAIGNGDGGSVIVWSDNATGAYGTISARGGSESGNGGFVEVSSKGWLDFHAKVDTTAPKGRTGTLLLDPADVCIYDSSTTNCPGMSGGAGSFNSGGNSSIFFSSDPFNSNTSLIQSGTLANELSFNHVTITTSNMSGGMGSITIADDLPNFGTSHMLQLVAHDDVNVKGRIWNTGDGELRIYAGWNEGATSVAAIQASPFADIQVIQNRGNINVDANIDMWGNTLLRAGNNININAGHKVSVNSAYSRTLTVHAGNAVNLMGGLLAVDLSGGEGAAATLMVKAGAGGVNVNGGIDGGEGLGPFSLRALGGSGPFGVPGGGALIQIDSLGPITLSNNAYLESTGGYGYGSTAGKGTVNVFSNSNISVESGARIRAFGGQAGTSSGIGGSALAQLVADGSISISDSISSDPFIAIMAKGVAAVGGSGDLGSGTADTVLNSGGNISVQNAFVGSGFRSIVGGEGAPGAGMLARVLMGANGALSVTNNSLVLAEAGDAGSLAGGMAEIHGIAGSVNVSGSQMKALGGNSSSSSGGEARLSLESPTGPITVVNQAIVSAEGGSGSSGGDGTVAVGGQGLLGFLEGVIDGGELDVNAALGAIATGPVSITDSSVSGVGGQGSQSSGGSGGIVVMTTGNFSMQNSSVHGFGGFGETAGGDGAGIVVASNMLLESTSSGTSPTTLLVSGGSSSSSGLLGSGVALLAVLGPTGELRLVNERVDVSGGQRGSGASATFGPGNIILVFPNRIDGGFFVDGVEGALSGGSGSPPGHGFRVNGQVAIPDTNFFTIYGGITLPPATFDAQLISSLFSVLEDLIPQTEVDAPTKEEKEKKKKEREC